MHRALAFVFAHVLTFDDFNLMLYCHWRRKRGGGESWKRGGGGVFGVEGGGMSPTFNPTFLFST